MSDKNKKKPIEENEIPQDPAAGPCAECPQEDSAQPDALAEELETLKDKHLRVCAEYDNFRKRSQKEREGVYALATAEVIASFIPVIDNMERACAAEEADEGVKMILKQLMGVLEKYGVRQIGQPGEAFDPNLHDAVAHEDADGTGENKVTEVLQKGYALGDKLIRPAMVKTAS